MRLILISLFIVVSLFRIQSETYVVSVGIANYEDNRQSLVNSENDAKAISEFYKQGTDNVSTITGKYATKQNILKTLKKAFKKADKGDKIIFYYSGHGYPGGLCPFDMHNIVDGLTYTEVLDVMKESKATNKIVFVDACNSGSIRTEELPKGDVMLFLASRGNEYSIENQYLAHGYFTKNLLRGLKGAADTNKDMKITAKELFNYVSENTKIDTHNAQHPVMWGNFSNDMVIVGYKKK